MRSDVNVMGMFFISSVIYMLLAVPLFILIRRTLFRLGFYRYVWHANLFEVALYVTLVCLLVLTMPL